MRRDHEQALAACERDLVRLCRSPATRREVLAVTRRFLAITVRPLSKIGRDDVRGYLALRQRQGVAASTQATEASRLRIFFAALVRLGVLRSDPTEGVTVARPEPPAHLLLREEDVAALLAAARAGVEGGAERDRARALRDGAVVELLYAVAMRSSEVRHALVRDLDLGDACLLVRRAKRGRPEVLPVPPATLAHLRRYLAVGRPVLCRPGLDQGRLLVRDDGRPYAHASGINKVIGRVARRAGRRAHPHALRRGAATHLVNAGVSLPAVQRLLGHADLTTTQVYVEVEREDLRAAVDVLEKVRP